MTETITLAIAIIGPITAFVGGVIATRVRLAGVRQDIEDALWARVQEELEQAYASIDALKQQLAIAYNRIDGLQEQIAKDLSTSNRRIGELQAELAQAHREIDALQKENGVLKADNVKLTDRVRKLEKRVGTGPLQSE